MPQFDTFTFCSQIFWFLATFTLLYLSLSYYLLPAISVTLKVRKRKLNLQSSRSSLNTLNNENHIDLQTFGTLNFLDDYKTISQPYNWKVIMDSPLRRKTIHHFCNTGSKSFFRFIAVNLCMFKA